MDRNARSKPTTIMTQKQLSRRRIVRWLLTSTLIVFSGAGLSLAGWLLSNGIQRAGAAAQQADPISPEALAQIEALLNEKGSRAGTQQKMDSQLIYEIKMRRGEMIAEGVQTLATDLTYAGPDKVRLDLKANVTEALLNQLKAYGANIVGSVPNDNTVRIEVLLEKVDAIAELPDVMFMGREQEAMTSRVVKAAQDGPQQVVTDLEPGFDSRAARVRSLVSAALLDEPLTNVGTGVGSRSSEGDATHRASTARGAFNVDGTGVKIGVLSDGVTNLAASQASGDLGPVTVLPGQAGAGDEGTAMLEIIHDVAPGAQLFFATAFSGITSFAQNIRALRAAGCDIIVDDIFYFVETPFQDGQAPGVVSNTNGGVVIQAVNDVTADGAMYFSSAGNSGNLNDGTSGVWEGNFVDGGPTIAPLTVGRIHNFGVQIFDVVTGASTRPTNLYWSDPLGGSSNDYDLFLLNAAGTAIIASSTNIQNGTQDPYEQIGPPPAGSRIVIVKKTGAADRFLHLNTNRGRLAVATAGQTHGHNSAFAAFGCAATPAAAAFPNPFSSSNVVETFSSDGGRRIFFRADGTPITPGDFSATGGLLRQKPDITAADGVSVTGVGGFPSPFFGTSAAAPHAAAIAALLKSANPSFTPEQIRMALTGSAIDIEAPGVDRDSGAGIIDAFAALQALGVPGFANLELGAFTATENSGDGNGQIDPGESAKIAIQLKNSGVLGATGVTATLTSSTPGVTIAQGMSAYPDLPAFGGSGTNTAPLLFNVPIDASCQLTINFTLTVSYTGGASPKVFSFTVQTGPPLINISSTLDTVAPTAGPGFTTATGTIAVRHFRDGVASSCGVAKPFPGTTQPGTRQFDAYTFMTNPSNPASCVTVTLSGATAINLFSAAYSGNFNPADLSQNYLADAGASAASRTYSFNIPAGQQAFTIVVTDVPPGPPSGASYTLNVTGARIGSCSTAPTTTTISTLAPVQYSDVVTLSSTTVAQFSQVPLSTGSVEFFVNDVSVGTTPVDGNGVATKNAQILLAAGAYPVKAVFTSSNPSISGSTGTSTLTVTKENAVVAPSASNPTTVKVNSPGGTAGPITLCATINEASDGSPGDISLATPVTFTLTPVAPGTPTITQTATVSGGGVGGTLTACATFNNVPVNVYDVGVSVGGNNYTGSGSSALAVFDPSLGFVTGAAAIIRDGRIGILAFAVKYQRNGVPLGELLYVENHPTGLLTLKSTSIQSLSIAGNTGVIIGKATVNGVENHTFRAIAVDNGEPGRHDRFGLQVTAPNGAIVPELTFDPITLFVGNIQVPHQSAHQAASAGAALK
jgi:Subtilase family